MPIKEVCIKTRPNINVPWFTTILCPREDPCNGEFSYPDELTQHYISIIETVEMYDALTDISPELAIWRQEVQMPFRRDNSITIDVRYYDTTTSKEIHPAQVRDLLVAEADKSP